MITGCVRASAVGEMLDVLPPHRVRLGERAEVVDCTTHMGVLDGRDTRPQYESSRRTWGG